jgi:DivIVA domain-containing protein
MSGDRSLIIFSTRVRGDGRRMWVTPRDVREHEFRLRPGGYDRDAVRHFLARVADDYEHALDAARAPSASVPDALDGMLESARQDGFELMSLAEEEAWTTRQDAAAHAAEIREQAAEECVYLKEAARERASRVVGEADKRMHEAEEAAEALARAGQIVVEMRSNAAAQATSALDSAYEQAADVLEKAEHDALELIREAESGYRIRVEGVSQEVARFEFHDEELRRRIVEIEELVERLLGQAALLQRYRTGLEATRQVRPPS